MAPNSTGTEVEFNFTEGELRWDASLFPWQNVLPPSAEDAEVVVINRLSRVLYVPTEVGALRLGPKALETVKASDVTEETRREETKGRIYIRNL